MIICSAALELLLDLMKRMDESADVKDTGSRIFSI